MVHPTMANIKVQDVQMHLADVPTIVKFKRNVFQRFPNVLPNLEETILKRRFLFKLYLTMQVPMKFGVVSLKHCLKGNGKTHTYNSINLLQMQVPVVLHIRVGC